jgi:hypothetical protein
MASPYSFVAPLGLGRVARFINEQQIAFVKGQRPVSINMGYSPMFFATKYTTLTPPLGGGWVGLLKKKQRIPIRSPIE